MGTDGPERRGAGCIHSALYNDHFVELSEREVNAILVGDGEYLGSFSTMYRLPGTTLAKLSFGVQEARIAGGRHASSVVVRHQDDPGPGERQALPSVHGDRHFHPLM